VLSEKQGINGYKSSGVVLWGYNDVTVTYLDSMVWCGIL